MRMVSGTPWFVSVFWNKNRLSKLMKTIVCKYYAFQKNYLKDLILASIFLIWRNHMTHRAYCAEIVMQKGLYLERLEGHSSTPQHSHNYFEFVYVLHGRALHYTENKKSNDQERRLLLDRYQSIPRIRNCNSKRGICHHQLHVYAQFSRQHFSKRPSIQRSDQSLSDHNQQQQF